MYPINLEKQNELTFAKIFRDYADKLNRLLMKEVRTAFRSSLRIDGSVEFRYDGIGDLYRMMQEIQAEHGDRIPREKLERILQGNYRMIESTARESAQNAWDKLRKKTEAGMDLAGTTLGLPGGQTGIIGGMLPYVSPFKKMNPEVEEFLRERVRAGVDMLNGLTGKHRDSVFDAVYSGIRNGDTAGKISENIQHITGVNESKARFWGRDQAGDVHAQMSRIRQTEAGFPGYTWKTMQDARVRDNHSHLHGKYFTWVEGAPGLTKPGAKHTGEDYECRCYPKPELGPPDAIVQDLENELGISSMEADRVKVEAIRGSGEERFPAPAEGTPEFNIVDPVYKRDIMDAWNRLGLDDVGKWDEKSVELLRTSMIKDHGIMADEIVSEFYGTAKTGMFSKKEISGIIQELIDFIPEDALKSNKFQKINIRIGNIGNNILGQYDKGVLKISNNLITDRKKLKETVYHELMHWLHDDTMNQRGENFKKTISDIFSKRTAGYPIYYDSSGGYRRDDRWWDRYAGRVYWFEKKAGIEPGSEVATMHFQLMSDPDYLVNSIIKDPERFPEDTIKTLKQILEFFE